MILKAKDGYRYTNGTDFGRIIALPETANSNDWYLITEEEYKIMKIKQFLEEVEDWCSIWIKKKH